MKNIVILGAALCLMAACSKNEGNKNVLPKDNTVEMTQETSSQANNGSYVYKAADGTRAKIDYVNTDKEKTATIEANGKKFQLDLVKSDTNGADYERNGIKASVNGDSVTITQGDNVIELVRDL